VYCVALQVDDPVQALLLHSIATCGSCTAILSVARSRSSCSQLLAPARDPRSRRAAGVGASSILLLGARRPQGRLRPFLPGQRRACQHGASASRRRQLPSDDELLDGIKRLAGDGYAPTYDLFLKSFRHTERRTLGKAMRRAANRGLILERQGPDGRRYVAVAAEGWRLIEARS
jgi:hypothetical protein